MSDDDQIRIVRKGLGSIDVVEITADEFETLEKGEPNSILKDCALVLLPIAAAYLPVLLLFEKPEEHLVNFVICLVVTILTALVGLVCLAVWYRGRGAKATVVTRIRRRMTLAAASPGALPPKVQQGKPIDLTETEGEAPT